MDNRDRFIDKLKIEIEAELVSITQEIERTCNEIESLNNKIKKINSSMDSTYSVFSASHTFNDIENTEIHSLQDIISNKEHEKNLLLKEQQSLLKRINDINGLNKTTKDVYNTKDIVNKLELINKFIYVDTKRASAEISLLIEKLKQGR